MEELFSVSQDELSLTREPFDKAAMRARVLDALTRREHGQHTEQERLLKKEREGKRSPTRFTTKAMLEWAKRKGWGLVARESYNFRTGRTNDVAMAMDALFITDEGLIGVQAGGRYQEAPHREKFEQCGGVQKAKERYRMARVIYVEFERGNPEPILEREWL